MLTGLGMPASLVCMIACDTVFFRGNTNLIFLKAEVRSQNFYGVEGGCCEEQWLLKLTVHCAGAVWRHLSFSGSVSIEV